MATLNKFFTNILLFGLSVNIAIFLFSAFKFDPQYSMPFMDLTKWSGWFNFSPWNILFTSASIAGITLASILLRSNTYAIYALLLAALGFVIQPVYQFMTAIPNALAAFLPDSTNPNFTVVNGVTTYGPNPLIAVILLIFAFFAFWFIFGLVVQRDIG
jgi:hypothetical protein